MKIAIFFAIMGMLLFFGLAYMHEQVHVAIYASENITSHVEYFGHGWDFVTIPDEGCKTQSCVFAHNENEMVGYHLMPFYLMIMFGLFIIIALLEERRKR